MNFKCLLGIHDWAFSENTKETYVRGPFDPHPETRKASYDHFVCCRCGKTTKHEFWYW